MKGVIFLLFLFFISIPARSALECRTLFSIDPTSSHVFDDYMSQVTVLEDFLQREVKFKKLVQVDLPRREIRFKEDAFELPISKKEKTELEEINLRDALEVMQVYYRISESIRKLSDDIENVQFHNQFSAANKTRFAHVEAGVLLRIAELLAAKGVEYTFSNNKIYISSSGEHFINRLVNRIQGKSPEANLRFSFSVRNLVGTGAGGIFWPSKQEINLHPKILLQKSFLQEGIALHEYTHFLDIGMQRDDKPFLPQITIRTTDPIVIGKLSIYKKGFSVDEIRAYRTSIRFIAHEALTTKSLREFISKYTSLQKVVKSQIIFSQVTKKVFAEYLADPDLTKKNAYEKVVSFSKKENYIIGQEKNHDAKATLELVNFTLDLFTFIDSKLTEYKDQKYDDQYKLIKQIALVMSILEVKRMNGNYPEIEVIKKQFDDL